MNYGVSIGHPQVRIRVMDDPGTFLLTGEAAHRAGTPAEIEEIKQRIGQGLERGAPAVGFGAAFMRDRSSGFTVAYTYAASFWEILESIRIAAEFGAPISIHVREGEAGIRGIEEIIAAAAVTGASVHIVHIQSSGHWNTPHLLEMIRCGTIAWTRRHHRVLSLYGWHDASGIGHLQSGLAQQVSPGLLGPSMGCHRETSHAIGESEDWSSFKPIRKKL